ncbi:heterogeneous nuclear ribonucleoprotein D-like [Trichoplusia ni]|uniref:Heterogeneous nuclear ribonucleoprotein D-like n=1 Tax=Trichoplusia ni TaxID=7111 RepID=A0A7E5VTZ7_TRINI|nr:heterogeneous nuclear ribonucleoprotein D-like [Trichoplusia ni]
MKAFILFCFFTVVTCQADHNNLEQEHRRLHDHYHQQYQYVDVPKIGREGDPDVSQSQVQRRFFPAYPAYGVGGGGYAGVGAGAGVGVGINAGLSAGLSAGISAGAGANAYGGFGGYGGYGYPGYMYGKK